MKKFIFYFFILLMSLPTLGFGQVLGCFEGDLDADGFVRSGGCALLRGFPNANVPNACLLLGPPINNAPTGSNIWINRPLQNEYDLLQTFNATIDNVTGGFTQINPNCDTWIQGFCSFAGSGISNYNISFAPGNSSGNLNLNSFFYINQQGNTGICNIDPQEKLHVNGSIIANSVILASDFRYKKDITTVQNCLDKIKQLRGVNYHYRLDEFEDINFNEGNQLGFIAQEVRDVLPNLVKENEEGYLAVNYIGIIPVLTEAVKEMHAENEILQQVNEDQNETIAELMKRVQKLEKIVREKN